MIRLVVIALVFFVFSLGYAIHIDNSFAAWGWFAAICSCLGLFVALDDIQWVYKEMEK